MQQKEHFIFLYKYIIFHITFTCTCSRMEVIKDHTLVLSLSNNQTLINQGKLLNCRKKRVVFCEKCAYLVLNSKADVATASELASKVELHLFE